MGRQCGEHLRINMQYIAKSSLGNPKNIQKANAFFIHLEVNTHKNQESKIINT